jgi:type VI secretion system protein ImpF
MVRPSLLDRLLHSEDPEVKLESERASVIARLQELKEIASTGGAQGLGLQIQQVEAHLTRLNKELDELLPPNSVEAFKRSLLRDLEWLLNTRETGRPASAPYVELERSIYNYGLPDFASMSADSASTPARLLRSIEREIELFEPRLKDVKISRDESPDTKGAKVRNLKFVIEATLRLDPHSERVEFDTVLEMHSGRFTLASGGG